MPRFPPPYRPDPPRPEAGGTATVLEEAPDPLLEGPWVPHRVLLTGATGLLGRELLPRLLHRGHSVRAVSRRGRPPGAAPSSGVTWRQADLLRRGEAEGLAEGCDRVVHLAGTSPMSHRPAAPELDVRAARRVAEEAGRAGVDRLVHVSALGVRSATDPYHRRKRAAEREVQRPGFETIVLRPAAVYGPEDHFTARLRGLVNVAPVVPIFGDWGFRLQPVAVEDVAEALCQAVERPAFEDRVLELAGPRPLPFAEILGAVAAAVGREARPLRVPEFLERPVTAVWRGFRGVRPLSRVELAWLRGQGVLEGEGHALRDVFRLEPLPFREVLNDYL